MFELSRNNSEWGHREIYEGNLVQKGVKEEDLVNTETLSYWDNHVC